MLQEVVLGKDIKLFVKVGGICFPIIMKIFGFDGMSPVYRGCVDSR